MVYSRKSEDSTFVPPHTSLEPPKLNIRSLSARLAQRLLPSPANLASDSSSRRFLLAFFAAAILLGLTACAQVIYHIPQYNFAGRPTPPSQLQQRVMVSVTANGSSGSLQILDGLRDIRNNVPNTIPGFGINGYSGGYPSLILNFPEASRGYVYSNIAPYGVSIINYGTESTSGSAGSFSGPSNSLAIAPAFLRIFAAEEQSSRLLILDNQTGQEFALNLPNVYKVAVNRGDTVALAMVRNSNSLYRVIKVNAGTTANPPGAIDCQPTLLPVYCVVPVPGNFDRPIDAIFSLDGSSAYILNCGQECGGGSNGGAGVSFIPQGSLQINLIPTSPVYPAVVTNTVATPGGATAAIPDGTNLYIAGQQLQPDGLFAGRLTSLNLITLVPSAPISISDGNHSKMLFADDNTLWIGSQFCATGERAKQGQNYNCLTRFDLGAQTASIVPANVIPGSSASGATVPYPNGDNNLYYYGSLTGLCWVQNYHKVYTAYGGQVHAFNTATSAEINNQFITVQGTALDVAYIDALTNSAN